MPLSFFRKSAPYRVIEDKAIDPKFTLRRWLPRGQTLSDKDFRQRNAMLFWMLFGLMIAVPVSGFIQSYPLTDVAGTTCGVAITLLLSKRIKWNRLKALAISVGLLTASSSIIHYFNGLTEAHFLFFIVISALALYEDWLPFLLAFVWVLLFNGVIGTLDPGSVYYYADAINNPWKWAVIHAGFVLWLAIINIVTWKVSEGNRLASQRLKALQSITEAGLSSLSFDALTTELIKRVKEAVGADLVTLSEVGKNEMTAVRISGSGLEKLEGLKVPKDRYLAGMVLKERKPILIEDTERFDDIHQSLDGTGIKTLYGVPVFDREEITYVVSAGSTRKNHFGEIDQELLQVASNRIATAIRRSKAYEQERFAAKTLQHSLLPSDLPEVPGVALGAFYLPGDSDVGGDWYDAFELPSGNIAMVIGDVVGHGIDAASMMGQLRASVRAYALDEKSPAQIAQRMNTIASRFSDKFATMVYMVLDPGQGKVTYVNAGHLLPIVRNKDGSVYRLEKTGDMPLGAFADSVYHEKEFDMDLDASLFLFTDGLVERKDRKFSERETELEQLISSLDDPTASVCQAIKDGMIDGIADDDVTVFAASFLVDRKLEWTLTYPSQLRLMRSFIHRWLTHYDLGAGETYDVVLAASEAIANSIEHAYQNTQAEVLIKGYIHEDHVELSVEDRGSWLLETKTEERGRGLLIIEEIMDEHKIEQGKNGTTVWMKKQL